MADGASGGASGAWGGPAVLYAVRHAESLANVWLAQGVAVPDGVVDARVALSPRGTGQAVALGGWLAGLAGRAPELVVCSPYERARRTWRMMAAEAARRGLRLPEARLDERLRDREMGELSMLTPDQVRQRAPAEARRREREGEWSYRPPGGESFAEVAARVAGFLTGLREAAPGQRVLLVAHDAVVLSVRRALAEPGAPVPDPPPAVPNASVSRWDAGADGRLRLIRFADTGHLPDGGAYPHPPR